MGPGGQRPPGPEKFTSVPPTEMNFIYTYTYVYMCVYILTYLLTEVPYPAGRGQPWNARGCVCIYIYINIYIYIYVLYILAVPPCEFKLATGLCKIEDTVGQNVSTVSLYDHARTELSSDQDRDYW